MALEFDADEQELVLFLAENNEHLQLLDQNVVQLEANGTDMQLLQQIFRSAHTIKGGAGMIGHHRMAETAHAMENVLDALRAGTLDVTQPTVDALLAALDCLRALNDEVSTRVETELPLAEIQARLNACLRPQEKATGSGAPSPEDRTDRSDRTDPTSPTVSGQRYTVSVTIDPESQLSAARTLQVYLELKRSTQVLHISPTLPEIEADERVHKLNALVISEEPASVLEMHLSHVSDVTEVKVEPVREAAQEETAGSESAEPLFRVVVHIDARCKLSAARTLQVYLELQRTTRVTWVSPTLAEIEADEQVRGLEALVALDDAPNELESRLAQIGDVIEARVEPRNAEPAKTDQDAAPEMRAAAPKDGAVSAPAPVVAQAAATKPSRVTPASPAGKPGGDRPMQVENSIRISVSIVDDLMSLVSELVLGRTRLQTLRGQLQEKYRDDDSVAALEDAVGHLDQVSNDLQATVMKARMLPVENVFNKFPRLVRDLATQNGKQITFTMSGQKTELDRSVIEQLSDPLVHLLRNCIDHGIEVPDEREAAGKDAAGAIMLSATALENHIVIEVRDNGRGIDGRKVAAAAVRKGLITQEAADRLSGKEAVDLVFAAGLSTARAITDISGRGVGMDIVKATIERMGGRIAIETVLGEGTTFSVTLPLTLAIMQALLVSVGEAVYALPLNLVTEILSVPDDQIHMLQGTEATLLRGTVLPLVRLRDWFHCEPAAESTGRHHIVATRVEGRLLGLVVDHFIGEQEIVMKPLGSYIGLIAGLAGATILGDGRIGLLVDVAALKERKPRSLHAVA
ncbi:MAG TPA: chemotaxis protein CheA [Chloroflexota bacterium]|nr:chemotaxis protein CheA [Chloroflexota bacterium]